MTTLFNRLRTSPFAAHVAHLGTGTLAAHLVTLAASPILSRLYTPEEFGLFSLFHSLCVLLSFLATGTYEYAIVLPRDEQPARQLVRLTTFTSALFSSLLFFGLMGFAPWLSELFDLHTHFLMLLPLGVFTHACLNISTNWLIRQTSFKTMSFAKMGQALSMGGVQIGFGAAGLSAAGLAATSWTSIGMLAGYIAGRIAFVTGAFGKKRSELRELLSGWNRRELIQVATLYKDHPRYVLLSSLLSAAAIELPVLLITSLFGNEELGHYGLAFRVLMAPVTLIGTSVGHVFFQKFARRKSDGLPLAQFLLQIWGILALIAILPFGALFLFGQPVFSFVFGAEWSLSGIVASVMAPMLFFTFLTQPTGKSMLVLEKQRWMPLFSVLSLVLRLAALITGALYFDFITALWLMVGGQILSYLIHSGFLFAWAKQFDEAQTPNA